VAIRFFSDASFAISFFHIDTDSVFSFLALLSRNSPWIHSVSEAILPRFSSEDFIV